MDFGMNSRRISNYGFWLLTIIITGLVGIAVQAWFGQSWPNTSGHAIGSDDAYITYRYAENLSKGWGVVFNKGERVEGYSNFLYLLLLTPAMYLGKNWIYTYSVTLNAIFFALALWLFTNLIAEKFGKAKSIIGGILMATNPWLWVNAATGLESMLVLFITVFSLVIFESKSLLNDNYRTYGLLVLVSASILSRVDGFILAIIIAISILLNKNYKQFYIIVFFTIGAMVLYTDWRLYYYGDLIANTFYAKVASTSVIGRFVAAARYIFVNFTRTGLWLITFFSCILIALKWKNKETIGYRFFYVFPVLWIAYLICIGGDIYFERFLVVLFPFGIYAIFALANQVEKNNTVIYIAISIFIAQYLFVFGDGRFEYSLNKYDMWVNVGKFIGENYPGKVIAIDAAGKIPFFSGCQTIDMLGLNDKHIGKIDAKGTHFHAGHTKFDPDYVLSKRPDLILAWVLPNGDLDYGITKEKYIGNYYLKYLANSSRIDFGERNIIDVSSLNKNEIEDLIRNRHDYGILARLIHSTDVR